MSAPKATVTTGSPNRNKIGYKIPAIVGIGVALIFIIVMIAMGLKGRSSPPSKQESTAASSILPASVASRVEEAAPDPHPTCPAVHDGEFVTCEVGELGTRPAAVLLAKGTPFCQTNNVVAPNSNVKYYYTGEDGSKHLWKPGDDPAAVAMFVWYQTVHGTTVVGYGDCNAAPH